jgi:N6-adenosine-specific RNA methylase IME4
MPHGGADYRSANLPIDRVSQSDAAKLLHVSTRSVTAAAGVIERAEPSLAREAEQGRIAVSAAGKASRLEPDLQRAIADRSAAGESNVVRNVLKQSIRAQREQILGAKQSALPDKKYGVIYADPEWKFEVFSRETGLDRAADNHYPTSDLETICARNVASIAADDCVLFLWSTAPMQPQAFAVMAAWGFAYKSQFIWRKGRIGTGYWNRNAHEILLVGVRGAPPAPAMGMQFESVIDAPVEDHSAKPEIFAEMIEVYFPTLPKIELNRRGPPRPGWDAWGNEAQASEAAA